ncbi:MAG: GNAT family N-acetyltransferase [Burkholderiales bacterium]|nr:GNAT family N-acetyltransferase [Burkholderiales bacterium]
MAEGDWQQVEPGARVVRQAVFVVEQAVAPALEWDAIDARATHVLISDIDAAPCATGRLFADTEPGVMRIGRLAVLKHLRGRGLGDAVLVRLLKRAAEQGGTRAVLHAQTHAVGFYLRRGFTASGAEFIEDGIPHVRMSRRLPA